MTAEAASGFQDGLPGLSFNKPEVTPENCCGWRFSIVLKAVGPPHVTAAGRGALELALDI